MADKVPSWVLKSTKAPPPPPEPSLIDTLGEYAGVSTRALAPYATAATLGGAAGAPFAGVGALPGAAGGVLSLGAADLGTGLYNLAAPLFGGERVALPSETIQNAFERIGVGRRPQTAAQQVYSDILQAGAGGFGQAKSAQTLANVLASPRGQNFMRFLGQNARAQTAAAAGGAAAPSVAANYLGVENPYALTGLSLAGGVAGAKAGTPKIKIPTVAQVTQQADDAYKSMKSAGVRVSQPALSGLYTDITDTLRDKDFIIGSHPEVKRRLQQIASEFKGPLDFSRLDSLHSDIASAARTIKNPKTRMYMEDIAHKLEDFMQNLSASQVTSGAAGTAVEQLKRGKTLWRSKSQLSALDDITQMAADNAKQQKIPFPQALQQQYKTLMRSKQFARFTPEFQNAIRDVANGTMSTRALQTIASLSSGPAFVSQLSLGGLVGAMTQNPASLLIPATLGGTGLAAKSAANRMISSQAQRARTAAAGLASGRPGWSVGVPVAQQATQAPQRGKTATQRRDRSETPFWAIPQK